MRACVAMALLANVVLALSFAAPDPPATSPTPVTEMTVAPPAAPATAVLTRTDAEAWLDGFLPY